MPATTTSFDDETDDNDGHALEEDDENSLAPEREEENEHGVDEQEPNSPEEKDETKPTEFDIDGPTNNNEQCQMVKRNGAGDNTPHNLTAELLRIHHRMGHAPFRATSRDLRLPESTPTTKMG